jgi:hypothetical protein
MKAQSHFKPWVLAGNVIQKAKILSVGGAEPLIAGLARNTSHPVHVGAEKAGAPTRHSSLPKTGRSCPASASVCHPSLAKHEETASCHQVLEGSNINNSVENFAVALDVLAGIPSSEPLAMYGRCISCMKLWKARPLLNSLTRRIKPSNIMSTYGLTYFVHPQASLAMNIFIFYLCHSLNREKSFFYFIALFFISFSSHSMFLPNSFSSISFPCLCLIPLFTLNSF